MLTILADDWHPARLFRPGDAGGFWDFRPEHCAQNSDGTGAPVIGQPVGWVRDLSGNGNHLVQATTAAKPSLMQDADGRFYLDFDTLDDHFSSTFSLRVFSCAIQIDALYTNYIIDGRTTVANSFIWRQSDVFGQAWIVRRIDGVDATGSYDDFNPHVITTKLGAANNSSWTLCNRYTKNEGLGGRAFAMFAISRDLAAAEIARLERWLARRAGVVL